MASADRSKQAPAPQPAGRARRRELLSLRERASALETQLTALRRERGRSHDSGSAWRAAAACQQARRQHAVAENARLRHLLGELLRVRTQLERLVCHRKETLDQIIMPMTMSSTSTTRGDGSLQDAFLMARLFGDVASEYADLARVLSLVAQPRRPLRLELVDHPSLGVVMQSYETHALPFSWHVTASEVWQAMPELLAVRRDHVLSREHIGEDKMKFNWVVNVETAKDRIRFHVVTASQRFTTPERTVIVFASRLKASDSTDPTLEGMSVRHRTILVLAPMQLPCGSASATAGTAITTIVPEWDESVASNSQKDAVAKFLEGVLPKEMATRHQHIEDHMLKCQTLVAAR